MVPCIRSFCLGSLLVASALSMPQFTLADDSAAKITPVRQLTTSASKDQDDICFWVHPTDRSQSTIIASDKSASFVFVYDLDGKLLQQIAITKPGNIDIRQGVSLNGRVVDIVAVNQRDDGFKLRIFRVDAATRQLIAMDQGNVDTGPNYGGCLYHSRTGKLYFLCTSSAGSVEQLELIGDGQQAIRGTRVRTWPVGKCEGAVADDEAGHFYIAEEGKGIWKVAAEPDAATPGELIIEVGQRDGLKGDLEGLAIYRHAANAACLIVSDQGANRFVAFDLKSPHRRLGEFQIEGVQGTDGIDLTSQPIGKAFPEGIFACHTDLGPRAVQISSLAKVREQLKLSAAK